MIIRMDPHTPFQKGAKETALLRNLSQLPMPSRLIEEHWDDETWQGWLARLPAIVGEVQERWSLDVGEPFQPGGYTAWVAPARSPAGEDVVVKVAWRHFEADHQAEGLRVWDGDGAIRLLEACTIDEHTDALLLERCIPGTELSERPEPEQDEVIATLLQHLWRRQPAASHPFLSLDKMCEQWADEFDRKLAAGQVPLDSGLAREGIALFRELPTTASDEVLLCTDLHAGNVLASQRQPWLVIDPKPHVGDPAYDPLQHMLNCDKRLVSDPFGFTRRIADLTSVDYERLRLWLFARCVQESPHWPAPATAASLLAP